MSTKGKPSWGELRATAGGMTHAEIGELFGISRERVRQIERRALAKCLKKYSAMGFHLGAELPDTGKAAQTD